MRPTPASAPQLEPSVEPVQGAGADTLAEDGPGSCTQRAAEGVEEYRRQLAVLPIWWCVRRPTPRSACVQCGRGRAGGAAECSNTLGWLSGGAGR